ncbi:MAG TPA: hypothetical protein VG940_03985, partial [Gemmatimonadales bacterium]|nr:hypothetical protein [Gemmatimonadales bacterium]
QGAEGGRGLRRHTFRRPGRGRRRRGYDFLRRLLQQASHQVLQLEDTALQPIETVLVAHVACLGWGITPVK